MRRSWTLIMRRRNWWRRNSRNWVRMCGTMWWKRWPMSTRLRLCHMRIWVFYFSWRRRQSVTSNFWNPYSIIENSVSTTTNHSEIWAIILAAQCIMAEAWLTFMVAVTGLSTTFTTSIIKSKCVASGTVAASLRTTDTTVDLPKNIGTVWIMKCVYNLELCRWTL